MAETVDIVARVARLEALLEQRFGVRRGGLARRVASVGRGLPGSVRRDLDEVARAAHMAAHPKLALRVDHARVARAAARAEAHLKTVDAADRRRGRVLGTLGALAFNLLLFALLFLIVLRWRGYV